MAKVSENHIGKLAEVSYKLNSKIRIGGASLYELKVYLNGVDVFNSHRKENKISHSEAWTIFDCLSFHNQLRKTWNWMNRIDSEGSMNLSYNLVKQYNDKN